MIQVDIATKVVDSKTSIWVVFSGTRQRHLSQFLENRMLFIETPGISLPSKNADFKVIRQHTRMSIAIRDYHRGHRKDKPSNFVADYSDETLDNSDQILAGNVKKLIFSNESRGFSNRSWSSIYKYGLLWRSQFGL